MKQRRVDEAVTMDSVAAIQCYRDIESHIDWLRSIIQARVGCSQTADDLAGDVVQDALERKESWLEIQSPAPWLYRVALRKVFLEKRRRRRQQKRETIAAQDQIYRLSLQQQLNQPIELLLREEKLQTIWVAMEQLNGRDAEILMLKYVHGWSYIKISDNLGLELKRVAGRLRTARSNLKRVLMEMGIDQDES